MKMRAEVRIACECRRAARANKRRDDANDRLDLLRSLDIEVTPPAARMLCAVVRELRHAGLLSARAKRELSALLTIGGAR